MRLLPFVKRTASGVALGAVIAAAALSLPSVAVAQDSNPPAAAALGPIKGEIRFSWWGGQSRNEKTDQILQLFEKDNPEVSVARENSDWQPHWDKLTIQSAAGNQPCTIQMQTRWLATYAKPNILMPLDDLLASGALNVEGIAKPILDSSRGDDGKLYMIPSGVFYFALLYNKTMLENAGLEAPAADWTWGDMAQMIKDVAPTLPKGVNATHNMGREVDAFVSWVQSHGQPMFVNGKVGFDKQVVVDWFNYWEEMRKAGLTDSPEEMVADNGSLIEESNIANGRTFITNRPANRIDSHQKVMDAVAPGSELSMLSYPLGDDGTPGFDVGANGIAIGATCKPELLPASVAWVNFFTEDPRAAKIYESDNGVVAVDRFQVEQANAPTTSRGQREQIEMFRKVAPLAKPVNWPAGGYGAMTETLQRGYDAVAFETMSSEDAAAQFIDELNGMLK